MERLLATEGRNSGSQKLAGQSSPAFFVVGRGKSGTSWLMRMFNAHPEVLCRGEGRFFGQDWVREDLAGRDWTAQDLEDEQTTVPPKSLYGAIRESGLLRLWVERSVWSRGDDTERHLAAITRAAADHFLTEKLAESGKKIVGDKTPLLTPDFIKDIGELYPDAKVIHIIRDGRGRNRLGDPPPVEQSRRPGRLLQAQPWRSAAARSLPPERTGEYWRKGCSLKKNLEEGLRRGATSWARPPKTVPSY